MNTPKTANYKKYQKVINEFTGMTFFANAANILKEVEDSGYLPEHSELLEGVNCVRLDIEDVLNAAITDKKCPRCGKALYLSDLEDYDYTCVSCDENFYDVEV